jgi:hypothetical protein
MDEALELGEFLPQSFANASEATYLEFLWSAFETNYREGRYEFASLAFHLLYMSFVSFSIWQIRLARPDPFAMAMVGFPNDHESDLMACESPFKFYDRLKESQIFRFLKLIGCTNAEVGEFAKFVRRRNKIAHPSGTVFFNDRDAIDKEIAEMMREVRNIEAHMQPVIVELYLRFLAESANPDEREYAEPKDEITAKLLHKYYMSAADIAFCQRTNIGGVQWAVPFAQVEAPHEALAELFPSESEPAEAA